MVSLFQNFGNFLQTIGVTDVIDIAIIAYVVYRIILLLQRSSSAKVVKGIVFLIVALLVSSLLNLNSLNFFLSKVVEIGILALIIIFQPELRRLLEQVGSSTLGGILGRKNVTESVMESAILQTVLACSDLAKEHTGALIVFERNNSLAAQVRTGTKLDAETTSELLKNIFFIHAPMHDGAAIIREGRIAGAGCVLPLSNNVNISKELGMRHRAGIGVSEQTDAVVVVVSEETGAISFAAHGMLKRNLQPDTLEKLLHNELMPDHEETEDKSFFGTLSYLFKTKRNEKNDQ